MHTTTVNKTNIIEKFSNQIELSNTPYNEWKIGIASLERISRLDVQEEILYQFCDMDTAKEILFNFIAQGVQTCKMSKSNFNGIYLYR
ncbi:hypothetical protein MATR_06680 [Marivirga tractuosa]|uniref:Uncharacterized protein n=1 Tax=Marivirga tractuosa (strain ATCC 23168 / DSM 4126 / NBRC 15989 / NCIMB 1408 / VKM B-1430 / H-43) TaxID=643867 RepID=E4TQZ9_MARTH|nr:hypothetical protein [Marivirga tractuosa]ADR21699.1 hypothetical protein Ftrac_1711 [Marivirga tractuosa DSM 4126]BDD13843.1 hypothetical protein MATR_06680 [Marivirga tractuosa]